MAEELGADGIILARINEPSAGAKIASMALLFATENYHEPERTGEAVAIRFLEKETEE